MAVCAKSFAFWFLKYAIATHAINRVPPTKMRTKMPCDTPPLLLPLLLLDVSTVSSIGVLLSGARVVAAVVVEGARVVVTPGVPE